MKEFLNGRVTLHPGDCRASVAAMPEASIDSVVTDPPYSLVSIVKRFCNTAMGDDTKTSDRSRRGVDGYARAARGFMGKTWDTGEVAFDPEFWASVLRVLKPGGHLVAFSGTRTYHRMVCAIEDAGFEIRDQIGWAFGTGFPKSHNAGEGRGTALKPAWEPICLARKPLIGTVAENVLAYGTGAINIDACRVAGGERPLVQSDRRLEHNTYSPGLGGSKAVGSTALGRWPANLVHDGSDEVLAAFPETGVSSGGRIGNAGGGSVENIPTGRYQAGDPGFGDSGSAARFFYSAKADGDDRLGSKHPTVKPIDLMRWLCRLVTPPGGTILDPFAGTGTTGEAAYREGFSAVLCEREAEYQADIERRMSLVMAGPRERRAAAKKQDDDLGPLFR